MGRRILVFATSPIPAARLDSVVRARAGDDAELHVIAPAANVSRLQWLTDDIDDARVEAGERAEAIADRAETDNAQPHIGDTDPLQAIEDGLRLFPADEIIVITHGDEQATWLEAGSGEAATQRFAMPVTHLSADEMFAAAPPDDTAQNGSPAAHAGRVAKSAGDAVVHPVETMKDLAVEAQHGQSPRTPLLAFTGVTVAIAALVIVILAAALFVYYL